MEDARRSDAWKKRKMFSVHGMRIRINLNGIYYYIIVMVYETEPGT